MQEVGLIPVLQDNYVFVVPSGDRALVVDPAVAEPVIAWLESRQLELEAVLQTHHHSDHIGGTPALLRRWPQADVVASAADRDRIPFQTVGVQGGDRLCLLGMAIEVLEVPGHTRAHLAYHLPERGDLFCGDTLFAAGCGRLFEGSAEQMLTSLRSLGALPPETRVWCAHEYTEGNLRWAAAEAPGDRAIADRLEQVRRQRREGLPTIPSSIALERSTNLFLRAEDSEELARLRESKNQWCG
ncbi:MAG: hydroxyacylglutathione hydrolase [Cyanobacteriota bacterium]|jgi:hydroxyacylglutathione hydrolase